MQKTKRTLAILSAVFSIAITSTQASALEAGQRVATKDLVEGIKSRDGRWFEVEMIVFERKDNLDFREHFENEIKNLEPRRKWDLVRDHLQPDISLLLNAAPECHQNLNPLAADDTAPIPTPEAFYQAMQNYQDAVFNHWQFTNDLCLLPDEQLSGYWLLNSDFTAMDKEQLKQVPLHSIPERVTAGDYDDFHDVYLLADQNLQLKEHFYTLKRNRSLNPILHMGWRQPGLSKRRSIPVYILAGEDYSDNYTYDGYEIVQPEPLEPVQQELEEQEVNPAQSLQAKQRSNLELFMQKIQAGAVVDFKNNTLVEHDESDFPKSAWQLDGYVQVHLNHYLFINAEFNFREPQTTTLDVNAVLGNDSELQNNNKSESTTEVDQGNIEQLDVNYLQNYYFKQNRRVYSGDIHYLDHPKFGILIQIRKYRH